jgi:CheY-like chemotaxis protein
MELKKLKHVLYIDDDTDDLELLGDALQQVCPGVKVTPLLNCETIFATLDAVGIPDVIVLDMSLPGKSGIDCLKELREHERYSHIPVVMYSTSPWNTDEAKRYGAHILMQKGYSFADVVEFVNQLCKVI